MLYGFVWQYNVFLQYNGACSAIGGFRNLDRQMSVQMENITKTVLVMVVGPVLRMPKLAYKRACMGET